MLDALPLFSRIMWISITVLEYFLTITLLRWDAWKRYPLMCVFVAWQAVGGSAALLIARVGPRMYYFVAFYVVTLLANVIAFAVALELYYKVFDPTMGLRAWGLRHMAIMISISLSMAIVLGLLLAARNGGCWTRTMVTIEQITNAALWATFCMAIHLFAIAGIHLAVATQRNCHRVHSLSDHFRYFCFYPGKVLSWGCAHCWPGRDGSLFSFPGMVVGGFLGQREAR